MRGVCYESSSARSSRVSARITLLCSVMIASASWLVVQISTRDAVSRSLGKTTQRMTIIGNSQPLNCRPVLLETVDKDGFGANLHENAASARNVPAPARCRRVRLVRA